MKLKYDFAIEEVAGKKVAMVVGENIEIGGFFQLNDTGVYIMELLKNDITVDEIVKSIQKDFEVDSVDEIKEWVELFIENLKKADVLE